MRYINTQNPNIKVLVSRGPTVPKGENPNSRVDKWVEFRFGMCETDDPEAIAVLDTRRDCVRQEDFDKKDGYIRARDIEEEVERRVRERLGQLAPGAPKSATHAESEVSREVDARITKTVKCEECGREFTGRGMQMQLAGHMRTHKKELAKAG